MVLRKGQKNTFFKSILEAGFNPREFTFAEDKSCCFAKITLKENPDFYFSFKGTTVFSAEWCPGITDWIENSYNEPWNVLLHDYKLWLSSVKEERETPDLWAEMQERKPPPSFAAFEFQNAPISPDEAGELVERLRELESRIHEQFQLQAKGREYLTEQFSYLIEGVSSGRLGRKDWKLIFISTMIGIATAFGLNPEHTKILWQLVQQVMHSITGFLPPVE